MSKLIVNEIEKYDAGQLTITTGTDVSIGSDLTVGGSIAGTLSTAAQTNITSVGTLSSLAVSGDVSIADKIIHTGDTNTAIRFPAADTVTIETDGTERLRVSSGGNVLIGTTTDSGGKLRVDGDVFINNSSNAQIGFNTTGALNSVGAYQYFNRSSVGKWTVGMGPADGSDNYQIVTNSIKAIELTVSTGAATFNSSVTIASGGNLILANGNGIDFSASAGGGATSSLLDDYEEGTWTPTYVPESGSFSSITYGSRTIGIYTKIGNIVYIQGSIRTDAVSVGTASGGLKIGGLPYTTNNTSLLVQTGSISFSDDFTANHPTGIRANENTDELLLHYRATSNGASSNSNVTNLTNAGNSNFISFNFFYKV